jgi:hypothetical protein
VYKNRKESAIYKSINNTQTIKKVSINKIENKHKTRKRTYKNNNNNNNNNNKQKVSNWKITKRSK